MFNKYILLGLALFFSPLAQGQKLLIKSPQASLASYRAFLMTEPKYSDYIDQYKKNLRSNQKSKSLLASFSEAQRSFFNEPRKKSLKAFIDVTGFQHLSDWDTQQRKSILFSFIRAFELSETEVEKEKLINQAAQFAIDLKLDPNIFSPPSVEAYNKSLNKIYKIQWKPSSLFNPFSEFLVNGKTYKHTPGHILYLPSGIIRITALSSSHKKISQIIDSKEISDWKPQTQSLVIGKCNDSQQLHPTLENKKLNIFFNNECIAAWPKKNPKSLALFRPQFKNKKLKTYELSQIEEPASILKNKWTWITVGAAVLTSLVINSQNKKNNRSSRVNTSGKKGF